MTPVMISIAAFVGVSALIGLVAFVLRDNSGERAQERLESLIGKRRRPWQCGKAPRHVQFIDPQFAGMVA